MVSSPVTPLKQKVGRTAQGTRMLVSALAVATSLVCSVWTMSIHLPLYLPLLEGDQRSLRSNNLPQKQQQQQQQQPDRFLDLTKGRQKKTFQGHRFYENDNGSGSDHIASSQPASRILMDNEEPNKTPNSCSKWAIIALASGNINLHNSPLARTKTTAILQQIEEAMPINKSKSNNDDSWCAAVITTESQRVVHSLQTTQNNSDHQSPSQLHVLSLEQIMKEQGGPTSNALFMETLLLGSPSLSLSLSSREEEEDTAMHNRFKNAGYLYALQQGADYILDLEYGPEMQSLWRNIEGTYFHSSNDSGSGEEEKILVDVPLVGNAKVINPHTHIFRDDPTLGSSWPRGFPKHYGRPAAPRTATKIDFTKSFDKARIGVVHQLSPTPDLDSQGRLLMMGAASNTIDFPTTTTSKEKKSKNPLVVPRHTMIPYNAEATLHTPATLWATLLPMTLPRRLSDVFRAYVTQTMLGPMDLHTIVVPPPRKQRRERQHEKPHNTVTMTRQDSISDIFPNQSATIMSTEHLEVDSIFYTQVPDLLLALEHYSIGSVNATSIPQKLEGLWIHLYEEGFLGYDDVMLVQHWLGALANSPYDCNSRAPHQITYYRNVVLMGQFTFATYPKHTTTNDLSSSTLLQLLEGSSSDKTTPTTDWTIKHGNKLVVQEDNTEMVAFWVQKWREVFAHVVVRGPFSNEQLQTLQSEYMIDAHGMNESRWNYTINDHGLYSPIANLVYTLENYKTDPDIDGVIYIHDDSFLNISNLVQAGGRTERASLSRFPSDNILATGQGKRESFFDPRIAADKDSVARRSYSIYPDGTFSKLNGQKFGSDQTELLLSLEHWPWNPEHCLPRLVELARDPRVEPYQEKEGDQVGSILIPPWEPSDFLFLPTKYAEQFVDIASLFLDHQVFLECSLPTILDMMGQQSDSKIRTIDLCSSWDEAIRNTDEMISTCPAAATKQGTQASFGLFHPYKLSNGLASWDSMFDLVTSIPFPNSRT